MQHYSYPQAVMAQNGFIWHYKHLPTSDDKSVIFWDNEKITSFTWSIQGSSFSYHIAISVQDNCSWGRNMITDDIKIVLKKTQCHCWPANRLQACFLNKVFSCQSLNKLQCQWLCLPTLGLGTYCFCLGRLSVCLSVRHKIVSAL